MLVVFVLVGIIAAIAIRSIGDTFRRDRINKSMAILSADMEQCFALAARQRAPMRLIMSTSTLTISCAQRSDTTYKYRTRNFKTGDLAVDFLTTSRTTLDIMPNGLATDTLSLALGIYSTGGSTYSRTLRMTRAGMVRLK